MTHWFLSVSHWFLSRKKMLIKKWTRLLSSPARFVRVPRDRASHNARWWSPAGVPVSSELSEERPESGVSVSED